MPGNSARTPEQPPAWRDPADIDPAILIQRADEMILAHPGWDDAMLAAGLAFAYPGFSPEPLKVLLRQAAAAARDRREAARQALEELRARWGDLYDVGWCPPDRYIAVSLAEDRRTFTAPAPQALERALADDSEARAS